jgi:four helix bundle protein
MGVIDFKLTRVYKLAFEQAMDVFEVTKTFPKEEKYSLIDQVRRCSRSVNANLGEAYRKKKYPAHFVLKITDCDAGNTETGIWLDFALSCEYLGNEKHAGMAQRNQEIGRLLCHMISNPEKY